MGEPTITLAGLRALKPCSERYDALRDKLPKKGAINVRQAVEAGATFSDLVWVASSLARKDKDVERRVRLWLADCASRVLHIYEKTKTSPAPRNAIIAARQYARGEIDDAARDAARAAAWAAARDAAWAAAWAAERKWQEDRLIAWLSDPEPEDWPLPEQRIAQAAE